MKLLFSIALWWNGCSIVSSFGLTSTRQQQRSSTSSGSSFRLMAKPKVFIDGEAGTTGIQVRDRLAKRDDIEIISTPYELRKDEKTRQQYINEADAVILCKLTEK
jgi:N-acetyl-gamma-glutamyl-phosphate reductase